MNHTENCGKCHGNHWLGVDSKGKLIENWEQDLINSGVSVIDLRKQFKPYLIFQFTSNEPKSDIRLYCSLITVDREHYSLYYKFEKYNCMSKEILRTDVYGYDLYDYVDIEMMEFEDYFENKYNELVDTCLKIRNGEM